MFLTLYKKSTISNLLIKVCIYRSNVKSQSTRFGITPRLHDPERNIDHRTNSGGNSPPRTGYFFGRTAKNRQASLRETSLAAASLRTAEQPTVECTDDCITIASRTGQAGSFWE